MKRKKIRIDEKVREKVHSRLSLLLLFAFIAFCILLISMGAAVGIVFLLNQFVKKPENSPFDMGTVLLLMAVFSLIIGTAVAFTAGRIPLKPVNRMISQMNRLASGDFKARLHFGKTLSTIPAFSEAEESFNKMAAELENTEMLRSDFINNFSHEFKTPIVSIAGFAKLLKRGNLTDEQKAEYVDVIEEESMRLAYMATNILNLTKVENQAILTDVTCYNLSEQIRSAVLLLENKWAKKNLDLSVEFSEYEIEANEELLKQVWINLVDNAVKFSPDGGLLEICISGKNGEVQVEITNQGEIPPEAQQKIWNKFYQADESHAAEGNGVGLAIVKRIVRLHGGTSTARSENGRVTFTVTLPKTQ